MPVDCIREWLACICLVGVAAFTVAWLVLANRSRLVLAEDRIAKTPRSAVAAFLFFIAIATVCAQKPGGTNAPPNGASPPQMVPPSGGNVELRIENVELRNFPSLAEGEQHHNSPFYILNSSRCGEWFVRSAANDSVTYANVADSGVFRRTYEVRSRHVDPSWNLVKVTRRGFGVVNENVTVELVESGFGLTIKYGLGHLTSLRVNVV